MTVSSSTVPAHAVAATVARMSRDEAKILAHYSAGETVRQIVAATGSTAGDVELTIDALAGGNRQRAHDLALEYAERQTQTTAKAATPSAPVTSAAQDTTVDLLADLLNRAVAREVPRLVRDAEKISDLLDELEKHVKEHERGQALRAEAASLEARLAEIRQQLGSARRQPAGRSVSARPASAGDSRRIRAWAAENSVPCSTHGVLPRSVREAYEKATGVSDGGR
jgi:hypothetical protein